MVRDWADKLTYYVRRSDGVLLAGYQYPGGSTDWYKVQLALGAAGNPAVSVDTRGAQTVFARKSDGTLWYGWQSAPAQGPWFERTIGSGIRGDPAAFFDRDRRESWLVQKSDGGLWWGVREGDGWKQTRIID
jgi:hypothetical protein